MWREINESYVAAVETFSGTLEVFPPKHNIFRCFQYFDISDTKVVILGQDPYHAQPGQATGLCFGVENGTKTPPSLRNIVAELETDLGVTLTDESLEHWAKQGVLMLNATLTVLQGNPNAHAKWWSVFTQFVIDVLKARQGQIVFVAWGAFAYDKLHDVSVGGRHKLIVSSHPSPLSCTKTFKNFHSFRGSRPFSSINAMLEEFGIEKINW